MSRQSRKDVEDVEETTAVHLPLLSSSEQQQQGDEAWTTATTPTSKLTSPPSLLRRLTRSPEHVLFAFFTLLFTIYFRIFSTLFLYLASLFVVLPLHAIRLFLRHSNNVRQQCFATFGVFLTLIVTGIASYHTFLAPDQRLTSSHLTTFTQSPIFIAINLYNSYSLFPAYGDNLIRLVDLLGGPDAVFISIFENNSNDGGKTVKALSSLANRFNQLGIPSNVTTGRTRKTNNSSDLDKHKGQYDADAQSRIEFLARIRNEALSPLTNGLEGVRGNRFGKILWLNDVIFDPRSVHTLLMTNNGTYDASCAFDYLSIGFYDTWVARDTDGLGLKPLWPHFRKEYEIQALKNEEPILVNSCWNGAVAFDARWFMNKQSASSSGDVPTPLRFRADARCTASESLLVCLDIHRLSSPLRPKIFINPKVSVAYNRPTFYMYHYLLKRPIVWPWRIVWQDWIAHRLFGWISEIERRRADCHDVFQHYWARPI